MSITLPVSNAEAVYYIKIRYSHSYTIRYKLQ